MFHVVELYPNVTGVHIYIFILQHSSLRCELFACAHLFEYVMITFFSHTLDTFISLVALKLEYTLLYKDSKER